MSTGTDAPSSTEITLLYLDDHWLARDETTGVTAEASTRHSALEALDEAIARSERDGDESDVGIPQDDPFFSAPTFSSGKSDVSENVDEYLTEGIYRDKVKRDEES